MKKIKKIFRRGFYTNEVEYSTLQKMIKEDSHTILLDVRNILEFEKTHLLGALNIPLSELENKVGLLVPNRGQTIIVYCDRGVKSKVAVDILEEMGYTNIYELKGGLDSI